MKHIHHLTTGGLVAAMLIAVAIGETIAWYVTKTFDIRFPAVAVGAVCIGTVGAVVSWLYDGRE